MSRVYDALLVAALEGAGYRARAVPVPDAAALARGRALLPRGYPLSTLALAGALVRMLEAQPGTARGALYLAYVGSAPGLASAYRLGLERAERADIEVLAVDASRARSPAAPVVTLAMRPSATRHLLRAICAADVIRGREHLARAEGCDAERVGAIVEGTLRDTAAALREGKSPRTAMAALGAAMAALERAPVRGAPRVSITGDAFCVLTDGPLGAASLAPLRTAGARVEPSLAIDWLLEIARRAGRPGLARVLRRTAGAFGRSAGLARPELDDPEQSAARVQAACGRGELPLGAHRVVAAYLAAALDDRADLVLALDPFLCTVSTAEAVALVHGLSRRHRPRFLALELAGDAGAQVQSRLELALDLARGSFGS